MTASLPRLRSHSSRAMLVIRTSGGGVFSDSDRNGLEGREDEVFHAECALFFLGKN